MKAYVNDIEISNLIAVSHNTVKDKLVDGTVVTASYGGTLTFGPYNRHEMIEQIFALGNLALTPESKPPTELIEIKEIPVFNLRIEDYTYCTRFTNVLITDSIGELCNFVCTNIETIPLCTDVPDPWLPARDIDPFDPNSTIPKDRSGICGNGSRLMTPEEAAKAKANPNTKWSR